MNCWQALANAIIINAVKEYLAALRRLKRHPNNPAISNKIQELERFFHSEWYELLTNVNPDYLIGRLRKQVIG